MFNRMFGRRKSPVIGESPTDPGIEAIEEKCDDATCDGFIVLDDTSSQSTIYDPPPGYTVGGASAFLPYGIDPRKESANSTQRPASCDIQTAIDGVPFKLSSYVLLDKDVQSIDISSVAQMIGKINSFNWDNYEYSFELERSILQEFTSTEQASIE
ncbi:uncharacterized protein LOC121853702 [Homarus americanus]|uniref:UMA domain-containing protein n=1 Tax=Homarus americanus TaxID=6706 RepID=A0A8J5MM98_HOMAM|nr:uncharacterized protein LOC121853702 [Homarus americanus]XP_042203972.1 uncharacterized protein LOC121853702 [Homarus americanus]KAG7156470.1 hypothetical protein Hamer_G020551 [Homarus americanus]